MRWLVDRDFSHEGQIDKSARVIELINAYRTSGHLMADTDPLEFTVRTHPDLDITRHGLTLWDLDREFPVDGFAGEKLMKLRDILGVLRDAYCRRVGVEYMHITDPDAAPVDPAAHRGQARCARPARSSCTSSAGSTSPRRSRRSCRPSTSARSGSASRAARR